MKEINQLKFIGVTGSVGKTSVCEILYHILSHKGRKVSLYSSNGLFINNKTRCKDYFKTTLDKATLDKFLELDAEDEVDYVIIEITGESVKSGQGIETYPYEVVALTSFYPELCGHYDSKEELLECKRKILQNQKKALICSGSDDPLSGIYYDLFKDINHITYGYTDNCVYQSFIEENNINGLTLNFKDKRREEQISFKTNLITEYNARNITCALAILSEVNELNINDANELTLLKQAMTNIRIRGRFEKMLVEGKTVILDTGYNGFDVSFGGVAEAMAMKGAGCYKNLRVIYANSPGEGRVGLKAKRKKSGSELAKTKYVYLTSFKENENELRIFTNEVMQGQNIRYEYIPDVKEAVIKALGDLEKGEVLIINTREKYRRYKKILEEIKGK